jgi:hypothetical protein
MLAELPTANLTTFSRKYIAVLGDPLRDEEDRKDVLVFLQKRINTLQTALDDGLKRQDEVEAELKKLPVEEVDAQRRMTDLHGKLTRQLTDCDLIILSRFTRLPQGPMIPVQSVGEFYRLDDAQLAAVKDFLKAGKPVLACLGPINEQEGPETTTSGVSDSFEKMLAQLGIWAGSQTVLFNVQAQDLAEQRRRRFQQAGKATVPEAEFAEERENESGLAESLRITTRIAGSPLDLRMYYPRPVYFDDPRSERERQYLSLGGVLAYSHLGGMSLLPSLQLKPYLSNEEVVAASKRLGATLGAGGSLELATALHLKADVPFSRQAILLSSEKGWNESQPFPTRERPVPQYKPPDLRDPAQGTRDEKRLGPFPLGVAVETQLPRDWYSSSEGSPRSSRLVVVGHGGMFVDQTLSPAKEKFLLDSCNWLLGRDDLLNREATPWRYPRLDLSEREIAYWTWGTLLWLPVLIAFLGISVVMVRRAF